MREVMDGLFELFLVKDPKLELYQAIFSVFPDIQEWSMSDLYSRHPDPNKSFLYKYHGRKDDVIVLSNGEKVLPAPIETTLKSNPAVKGALVTGAGHFQPAVLIDLDGEPPREPEKKHEVIEALLPTISEANQHAPAHGKLDAYHTLFAVPEKPVEYLGQGKIQRLRTCEKYKDSIEVMYRAADEAHDRIDNSNTPILDTASHESIAIWLRLLVDDLSEHEKKLSFNQDIFEAGVDSLQVIRMAREIKFQARLIGWSKESSQIMPTTIYNHPTLNLLAAFIYAQSHGQMDSTADGLTNGATNGANVTNASPSGMQDMLDKYVNSLLPSSKMAPPASAECMTVLLTGSTGSLGSYLLDALYIHPNVAQIICLNRSSDAAEKHGKIGRERGLNPLLPDRVIFLKADLSQDRLGLDNEAYDTLSKSVTHVIRKSRLQSYITLKLTP